MKEKKQLIRIVRNNEGEINVDLVGKMPGRGAYICNCVKCFDAAVKAKRLEKTFKTKLPDDIYPKLREVLSEQNRERG